MDAAEKFDDLIFQYKNERNDTVYRFLQAKHRLNETKKITIDNLLSEENDFSLQKYFISYRRIKVKPEFKGGELKDFIICTNINFDFDKLENKQVVIKEIEENDEILNIENGKRYDSNELRNVQLEKEEIKESEKSPKRYKFVLDKQNQIYKTLKNTSDLHILARKLANCMLNNQSMDLKIDSKSYHIALSKEIINVKKKMFQDNFINNQGLSESAQRFREVFLRETSKIMKISEEPLNKKDLWGQIVQSKQLKLTGNWKI